MITLNDFPLRAEKGDIEFLGETTATRLRYAPPASLHETVSRLRIGLRYEDNPALSLKIEKNGASTIHLSTTLSSEQTLFQIAVSLGHYFLHYPQARNTRDATTFQALSIYTASRTATQEAIWWGAAFLMPKDAFSKQFKKGLRHASQFFRVTHPMAYARAISLGLHDPEDADQVERVIQKWTSAARRADAHQKSIGSAMAKPE